MQYHDNHIHSIIVSLEALHQLNLIRHLFSVFGHCLPICNHRLDQPMEAQAHRNADRQQEAEQGHWVNPFHQVPHHRSEDRLPEGIAHHHLRSVVGTQGEAEVGGECEHGRQEHEGDERVQEGCAVHQKYPEPKPVQQKANHAKEPSVEIASGLQVSDTLDSDED